MEFLVQQSTSGNTIPRAWLRLTDVYKASGMIIDLNITWTLDAYREKYDSKGGWVGGLWNTHCSCISHSVASYFWTNWVHRWAPFKSFYIVQFYFSAENCSGFSHPSLRKTAYDIDCRQKQATVCQVILLGASIQSQYFPGHSVSVLAEGTLPILHTGHSLQAAPWSGQCSVQIFGSLENIAF